MEINPAGNAQDSYSLSRKQADSDILQRSLEKAEVVQPEQKAGEPKQVEKSNSEKQGSIDFYA